jgi:hypothetical protein
MDKEQEIPSAITSGDGRQASGKPWSITDATGSHPALRQRTRRRREAEEKLARHRKEAEEKNQI